MDSSPTGRFEVLPFSVGVRTPSQARICVSASNSRGQPNPAGMLSERNLAGGVKRPHVERLLIEFCFTGGCQTGEGHGHMRAKLVALYEPPQELPPVRAPHGRWLPTHFRAHGPNMGVKGGCAV